MHKQVGWMQIPKNHRSWQQRTIKIFANQNSNSQLFLPTWTSHPKYLNNTHASKFPKNLKKQKEMWRIQGKRQLGSWQPCHEVVFSRQTLIFYTSSSSNVLPILNCYSKKKVLQVKNFWLNMWMLSSTCMVINFVV